MTNENILVVDDNPAIRTFLNVVLKANGYRVVEAATAAEGLKSFRSKHPDLVILDLGLPDQDGLELLSELRMQKNPALVIILTVRSEPEYMESAIAKGAAAYITKPFRTNELLKTAEQLLKAG